MSTATNLCGGAMCNIFPPEFSNQNHSCSYMIIKQKPSIDGPFVYRLGRKIFILERAVRLCYGLPLSVKFQNLALLTDIIPKYKLFPNFCD